MFIAVFAFFAKHKLILGGIFKFFFEVDQKKMAICSLKMYKFF